MNPPIPKPTKPCSEARAGFTLVELAITVAIVGVLATVAIPQYYHMLLRSKRSELPINLDGIRTTELGYHAEWSAFTACALRPSQLPVRTAANSSGGPGPAISIVALDWSLLGWEPDGKVYGQYQVRVDNRPSNPTFLSQSYSDIDGDGNISGFQASHLLKPIMLTDNTTY